MARGKLDKLYDARLDKIPPTSKLPKTSLGAKGLLGVFDYVAGDREGKICLFLPEEQERLDGREKLRLGPGKANVSVSDKRLTYEPEEGSPCAWLIVAEIDDPHVIEAFLERAAAVDRRVAHILKMAREFE